MWVFQLYPFVLSKKQKRKRKKESWYLSGYLTFSLASHCRLIGIVWSTYFSSFHIFLPKFHFWSFTYTLPHYFYSKILSLLWATRSLFFSILYQDEIKYQWNTTMPQEFLFTKCGNRISGLIKLNINPF